VLLREDSDGGVAFEYDGPASVFGQFGDEEVEMVARQLDQDLQSVLEEARPELMPSCAIGPEREVMTRSRSGKRALERLSDKGVGNDRRSANA
jgi:hypothetical protein